MKEAARSRQRGCCRLVSGIPERLSLQVLAAFCDIFGCTPAELVTTTAENAGVRKTATGAWAGARSS